MLFKKGYPIEKKAQQTLRMAEYYHRSDPIHFDVHFRRHGDHFDLTISYKKQLITEALCVYSQHHNYRLHVGRGNKMMSHPDQSTNQARLY